MVRMSRTRGMRRSTTSSAVRRAAASTGSAEFFAPLVGMKPTSGVPPWMTNLSIYLTVPNYQARGGYGRANAT